MNGVLVKALAGALLLPAPLLAQAGQIAVTPPDSQKLVCKKKSETGSLVKKTKLCLTRAQWSRAADNHKKYAEELQDGLRTRPCAETSLCQ